MFLVWLIPHFGDNKKVREVGKLIANIFIIEWYAGI